jgi:4-hydroxybenzoate polyprenyltransferase
MMGTEPDTERERRKLKRPVVSDADGTREGGLVFCIVGILGFVVAAMVSPLALTSFWVWFALLMMAVAVASGTQKAVAWLNGHIEEEAET